jgi:putative spermidine/putrescine transport system substrate-binding protein
MNKTLATILAGSIWLLLHTSAAAQTVVYATDGGKLLDALKKTVIPAAETHAGVRINVEPNADRYPVIKASVGMKNPQWDLVDIGAAYCLRGVEDGLWEKLDMKLIPNAKDVDARFNSEHFVGFAGYSTLLAYNRKKFPNGGPKTWADFWDVQKYPGKRALRNYARPTLELALLADGVAPDKLYPLDVDRAYRKLEQIKPHIAVWWTSGAQSHQLLASGEVDMIALWDGRADAARSDGADVDFSYNGAILENVCLAVPKGARNKEAAMKVINGMLDPKAQAQLATMYKIGPLNGKLVQHVDPKRASELGTSPENIRRQVLLDTQWWSSPAGQAAEARWLGFVQK